MSLLSEQPENIIKEHYFQEYKKSLEIIWWELIRLNSTVYVLEKLINFPVKIFVPRGKDHFLNLVYQNFIENTILLISRIFTDNSIDAHTIIWFKNKIRTEYLKDCHVDEFDEILKENKFSKSVNELLERIHKIRSKLVAHSKREIVLSDISQDFKISFKDIKEVVESIAGLFRLVCYNHDHHLCPVEWSPNLLRNDPLDKRPDIEEILNDIVLKNPILKLPEEKPYLWEKIKSGYNQDELNKFNEYRIKFNLRSVI